MFHIIFSGTQKGRNFQRETKLGWNYGTNVENTSRKYLENQGMVTVDTKKVCVCQNIPFRGHRDGTIEVVEKMSY